MNPQSVVPAAGKIVVLVAFEGESVDALANSLTVHQGDRLNLRWVEGIQRKRDLDLVVFDHFANN